MRWEGKEYDFNNKFNYMHIFKLKPIHSINIMSLFQLNKER